MPIRKCFLQRSNPEKASELAQSMQDDIDKRWTYLESMAASLAPKSED